MNALANRASYGVITGSVSLNGVEGDTIGKFPRLTGMVPQDDIMHDDLTVYENLSFSAQLRLPSSMTDEQKKAIVEDALHLIGLDLIRDSVVGSPEKRGVSGGQKKRVNIGIELVAYPRVLFLDEPTRYTLPLYVLSSTVFASNPAHVCFSMPATVAWTLLEACRLHGAFNA
jgi:ABC-type multidrug transport system ATPase subunit